MLSLLFFCLLWGRGYFFLETKKKLSRPPPAPIEIECFLVGGLKKKSEVKGANTIGYAYK